MQEMIMYGKKKSTYGFSNRNYNSFDPLFDYNVVCYKCNNYGNISLFCRSGIVETYRQSKGRRYPCQMKERIHKSLEKKVGAIRSEEGERIRKNKNNKGEKRKRKKNKNKK
jgi:hypothetical protein